MEWAISVGAPWPTGGVRLRLKLNYKNVVNVSTDLTELNLPRWHLFTELRMERELTTPTNALTGMNSAWTGARRRIVSLCAAAGSLAMLRWARSLPAGEKKDSAAAVAVGYCIQTGDKDAASAWSTVIQNDDVRKKLHSRIQKMR
jgi:hypothetical protein